jgi:hypothetical protein
MDPFYSLVLWRKNQLLTLKIDKQLHNKKDIVDQILCYKWKSFVCMPYHKVWFPLYAHTLLAYLMRTLWSHGHATHNQDWDLIPESWKMSDRSVAQWKPAPRHQHYWNEVEWRHEVSSSLISQIQFVQELKNTRITLRR